jgi:hypothetical protein
MVPVLQAGHLMVCNDILHEAWRVYFGTTVRSETSFVMPELLRTVYRLQAVSANEYLEQYDFERLWPEVSNAAVVRYPDPAGAIRTVAERCEAWLDRATDVCALMDWCPALGPQHAAHSTEANGVSE